MALEKEIATYQKKLPEWKEHEGKFVLIHGETVVDFFSSYEDAIKVGYREFGVATPFLVRRVSIIEKVQFFTRMMEPVSTVASA